jgi:hypothetical protein
VDTPEETRKRATNSPHLPDLGFLETSFASPFLRDEILDCAPTFFAYVPVFGCTLALLAYARVESMSMLSVQNGGLSRIAPALNIVWQQSRAGRLALVFREHHYSGSQFTCTH